MSVESALDTLSKIASGEIKVDYPKTHIEDDKRLIQLAELGRIALQTQPCYHEYQYNDGDCHMEKCSSFELCRVRDGMLRGKV